MCAPHARPLQVPARLAHKFQLAYRKWPIGEPDHLDGWMIALVDSPADPAVAGYTVVALVPLCRLFPHGRFVCVRARV